MSSASLAVAARPHIDPARIAALSATLALNLAALLILIRPLAAPTLALAQRLAAVPQVVFLAPPPPVPPPPAIELKPLPHPPAVPVRVPPQPSVAPPPAVPSVEGTQPMPPAAPPVPAHDTASPAPTELTLAYRSAPLQFPLQALRQRMQGTVLLRVLVDETGKPLAVEIEHGSGHVLLDRSAREQVLHWRFQPAMVDGHAVRAWARVPVDFVLRDL